MSSIFIIWRYTPSDSLYESIVFGENSNSMSKGSDSSCIVDFSSLSTNEILQYFSKLPKYRYALILFNASDGFFVQIVMIVLFAPVSSLKFG